MHFSTEFFIMILGACALIALIIISTAVFLIVWLNKTHKGVFISTTMALLLIPLFFIINDGISVIPFMFSETNFIMGFLAFSAFMYCINHFLFNKRIHKKTDHHLPK